MVHLELAQESRTGAVEPLPVHGHVELHKAPDDVDRALLVGLGVQKDEQSERLDAEAAAAVEREVDPLLQRLLDLWPGSKVKIVA